MTPLHFGRREPGRHIAAAVRVLRDAGRPLTAREIAEEAVARGLIRPAGDGTAPDATMSSTLKRHEYGGPVVRVAAGGEGRGPARWTLRTGAGATPDALEKDGATSAGMSSSNQGAAAATPVGEGGRPCATGG